MKNIGEEQSKFNFDIFRSTADSMLEELGFYCSCATALGNINVHEYFRWK